jgi:uroporphyrinogen-III synthase
VAGFDWIAFTSANAVDALLAALGGPPPAATAVAAVGGATARALRRRGVAPRLVAAGGSGGALARELAAAAGGVAGRSVLLPLAADARPELAAGLAAAGARVTAVVAYDKRPPAGAAAEVARLFPPATPLGWVTFTSPRLARTFAELLDRAAGPWPDRRSTLLAASIGPTTSAELRRLGAPPAAEAPNPGDAELVAAVARAVGDTIPGP